MIKNVFLTQTRAVIKQMLLAFACRLPQLPRRTRRMQSGESRRGDLWRRNGAHIKVSVIMGKVENNWG